MTDMYGVALLSRSSNGDGVSPRGGALSGDSRGIGSREGGLSLFRTLLEAIRRVLNEQAVKRYKSANSLTDWQQHLHFNPYHVGIHVTTRLRHLFGTNSSLRDSLNMPFRAHPTTFIPDS